MTKPNMVNPQNFSVEALDRVGDFYKQSFEQLSHYYDQSFAMLFWILGGVGFIAGIVAPAIVWFVNNKILKKDRSEMEQSIEKMREELKDEINKIKEEYEQTLEENLKNFREDSEKMERYLHKKIETSLIRSLVAQSLIAKSSNDSYFVLNVALGSCLREKLDIGDFRIVIKNLIRHLHLIDSLDIDMQDDLKELQRYKADDALFQDMVSELQTEYDKALTRLKK